MNYVQHTRCHEMLSNDDEIDEIDIETEAQWEFISQPSCSYLECLLSSTDADTILASFGEEQVVTTPVELLRMEFYFIFIKNQYSTR